MKKFLGIAVISLMFLSACAQVGNMFNPIVGTWEVTALGVTTNEVYDSDATCSQTTTILGVGTSAKSGTWTSTSTTITRVWSDSSSDTVIYSFNSDNSQMTVTPEGGGLTTTFDRI